MKPLLPLQFKETEDAMHEQHSPFPFTHIGQVSADTAPSQANRLAQLESMLKEAQGRAELMEKEAYDKAYLAGEKAGMALGQKRGEQILESLQETLQHTDRQLQAIHLAFADAAIDLAEYIARQIVGDALDKSPETLLHIAEQAAAQLPSEGNLKIAVSPEDMGIFERLLEDEHSRLILTADPSIMSGECRIISDNNDVLINPVASIRNYLDGIQPSLTQDTPSTPDEPAR